MYILRTPEIKQRCISEINSLPINGEPWTVMEIKPPSKTRQQEKYFHKLLGLYCKHTGDNEEDVKREIKFEYLPTKECKGRVAIYNEFEEITGFNNVTILEPISSTQISTKQYNLLIDDIVVKCMRQNIAVPDPSFYGYDFGDKK